MAAAAEAGASQRVVAADAADELLDEAGVTAGDGGLGAVHGDFDAVVEVFLADFLQGAVIVECEDDDVLLFDAFGFADAHFGDLGDVDPVIRVEHFLEGGRAEQGGGVGLVGGAGRELIEVVLGDKDAAVMGGVAEDGAAGEGAAEGCEGEGAAQDGSDGFWHAGFLRVLSAVASHG